MFRKAYSYNELNDYGIDGFQIAGDDKNDSRSSVVTTSRDTSPEAIRKVKAFPSNNSLTKVEDKPTNLLKKQHSTGSSRIQFSADQTERQRDRGSHLSRDKDRSSITFRDNPSREKNRSMSQSTSEESDFSDHYRRRRRDARSVTKAYVCFRLERKPFVPSRFSKKNCRQLSTNFCGGKLRQLLWLILYGECLDCHSTTFKN